MIINSVVSTTPSNISHLRIFFKNINLIIENKSLILQTPDFCNIQIDGMGICSMYSGSTDLYLGDILKLWEKTLWRQGDTYTYFIGGSPLTGRNTRKGYNLLTNEFVRFSGKSFVELAAPAWNLVKFGKIDHPAQIDVNIKHQQQKSPLTIVQLIRKLRMRIK